MPGDPRPDARVTHPPARYDRREALRLWWRPTLFALLLGGAARLLYGRPGRHPAPDAAGQSRPRDWRVDPAAKGRIVVAGGAGPADNVRRALAAMGGIGRFVRRGERVVVKPNVAWDRTPEQAANTDPQLVAEIVRLCLAAGASLVTVADSTCHEPERTFERSGVGPAARAAGARVAHQGSGNSVRLDLGGSLLGSWDVLRSIAEADRVINVPIVKHHSLGRATLGMKNWFGALDGGRSRLHQRIQQVNAELGFAFRPTLTVVDATRILVGGGPTGGSLSLVRATDLVAVATDPVAADAWGGSLLGLGPRDLPHLDIAARLGLGTPDWESVAERA